MPHRYIVPAPGGIQKYTVKWRESQIINMTNCGDDLVVETNEMKKSLIAHEDVRYMEYDIPSDDEEGDETKAEGEEEDEDGA